VRPSFIPPPNIQQLRDLSRLRTQMVRERSQYTQRIQKTLHSQGYKLDSVLSDILGQSGLAILCALRDGQTDPEALAGLAVGNARKKRAQLVEALRGRPTVHLRFMLNMHLTQLERLEAGLEALEQELGEQMRPFDQAVQLLVSMPGVSDTVARVIVAETGADMARFASAAHLRSWAGLCPQMHQSAGKRKNTRLRKGDSWLKTTLVQAAWAAIRTKGSYLQSLYYRIKARRDSNKAIVAVAASMLTAVYHMLKEGVEYKELGPQQLEPNVTQRTVKRLLRRLEQLTGTPVRLAA
jgi:transposase